MVTYQDYLEAQEQGEKTESFLERAINKHCASDEFQIAVDADEYECQQNTTIMRFIRVFYTATGRKQTDSFSANNKLCSNYFHRLNTQRNTYLLGNGVSFTDHKRVSKDENGKETTIDETKEFFGDEFDTILQDGAYNALIHGVSFGFWNLDHLQFFKLTEFVPMWDEDTGALRAGIRFWRIEEGKPMRVEFYEPDGVTKYRQDRKTKKLLLEEEKHGYIKDVKSTPIGGVEAVEYSNYPSFPIIPLWGNKHHKSTLVGMKGQIDALDLAKSGFANDLQDVAEVYWILNGAGGMDNADMAEFLRKLKFNHVASVDAENSSATPYTQEIPYQARQAFITETRNSLYEDFGALDVHTISAGSTNDHIEAGYQPMDEEADGYELQVTKFIKSLLELVGIEDNPIYKRNKVSNTAQQTQMVLSASDYLDNETILSKLPFLTVDEVSEVMARKQAEMEAQMEQAQMAQMAMQGLSEGEE